MAATDGYLPPSPTRPSPEAPPITIYGGYIIVPDFSRINTFEISGLPTGDYILAAPRNARVGMTGFFRIKHDVDGPLYLAFSSAYAWERYVPPILAADGNPDIIRYSVVADGVVFCELVEGV